MRRTSPSIDSAAPSTTPARMHSSVRRPITWLGGTSSVAESLAALRKSDSADTWTPGAMTPPRNTPSRVMQSNVVAVPRSTTMQSRRCSRLAASVLMMRSAPTVSGSSTSRLMGSFERPSTNSGALPVSLAQASARGAFTDGTTDPMTLPSTVDRSTSEVASSERSSRCTSSGVRPPSVVTRHRMRTAVPSQRPIVVSLLPTSNARIMSPPRRRRASRLETARVPHRSR